jgi:shikimate dehydrogenase
MAWLTGLLGYPLGHSVSPAMHNAAFRALGLAGRYDALPTPPEELAQQVAGLAAAGYRGVNVTIPHKQVVMPLLDALSPAAQAIGAVNTVVVKANPVSIREDPTRPAILRGDNTDWLGFLHPLDAAGFDLAGKSALLLGAGGSARAVVYALIQRGLAHLTIWARNPARANELAHHAQTLSPSLTIHPFTNSPLTIHPFTHSPFTIPQFPNSPLTIHQFTNSPLTIHPFTNSPLTIHQFTNSPLTIHPFTNSPLTIHPFPPSPHLLINTTPLGMWPHVDASPWPADLPFPAGARVYDLVYRPERTLFLRQAEAAGCATQGGLEMLVVQGAAAFELWTGHRPPLEVMMAAARAALDEAR